MTRVDPCELHDRISLTPAIVPSERSSGVATLLAIVSGLAPGRLALTAMTGKSTCGSGDTGSCSERDGAGQHDRQVQQRRGDRAGDERGGEAHGTLTPWRRSPTICDWLAPRQRRARRSKNR